MLGGNNTGDDSLFLNSDDELDTPNKPISGEVVEDVGSKLVISPLTLDSNDEGSDLQPNNSQQQQLPTSSHQQQQETAASPVLNNGSIDIVIRSYEKRGEGINAYIIYKVETKVSNIPGYTKTYFEVWRRFSDFLGLREKLVVKYQQKGIIVPYAPEKSLSALTKTKLNPNDDPNANDLAERRCRLLERFLRRIAAHPRLVVDCDVRDFLSFDAPLPKAVFTSMLSSSNFKKMFKSVGDAFSKLAFPMDENDRWFEQVHNQVEELEESLVRLHSSVDGLVNNRRELSHSDEQFCKALSMLASCEENTALARTLSKLAETHENLATVERHEAEQDSQYLADELHEQLQLINALKEVFYERVKGWQNWQNQQQALTKKREIKTRLDLAGKTEKAAQYKEELKEQENRADIMEKEFLQMSKVIRDEYSRYCKQRREDIKKALVTYLESLVKSEQHTLDFWEKFAPETKNLM